MKMIALTPRGYWQSRRNRGDMLVTLLGVVWMVLHYMCISVQCGDFSNSFGYVIVVLRFFTITGKHVRQSAVAWWGGGGVHYTPAAGCFLFRSYCASLPCFFARD